MIMLKVLLTLPNSIAGTLILKGFKQGFKSNGCFVMEKDLRELTVEHIKRFKPDIIFGYDYGFLFGDDDDVKDYILKNNGKIKLVHYFADEPGSKYALVHKPHMFKIFRRLGAISYIWDRDLIEELPDCRYLPLAVNSKAYRLPLSDEDLPQYEISFVGRPLTRRRQAILSELIRHFGSKVNIFSYEKHFLQSLDDMKKYQFLTDEELDIYKSAYRGFLTTEEELARVYNNSIVNINITLQGQSAMNYRVFEVLASRGFLLTDNFEDVERNFVSGKELEIYTDVEDLIDKTSFYLKHPEFCSRIATLGYANVVKSHTYTARARTIIEDLKELSKHLHEHRD